MSLIVCSLINKLGCNFKIAHYTIVNMTGISSLFPAFPKQMSILDRVNITVARHKNDYFKN
jgi:hypothetical protein